MAPVAGNQKKKNTVWKDTLLIAVVALFFFLAAYIPEVATFLGASFIALGAIASIIDSEETKNNANHAKYLAVVVAIGAAMIAGGLSTAAVPTILFTVMHTFG